METEFQIMMGKCVLIKSSESTYKFLTFDFVVLHPPGYSCCGEYENFSMQVKAAPLSMGKLLIGSES